MVSRWRGAKNIGISIYGVFLFREREKSPKHRVFDAFWGFAKTVDLTILGVCKKIHNYTKITTARTTGPSSNSYNNNDNNNNDDDDGDAPDDDEDDDNNDNDDNDDNRHRRCAKLYNCYINEIIEHAERTSRFSFWNACITMHRMNLRGAVSFLHSLDCVKLQKAQAHPETSLSRHYEVIKPIQAL